MLNKKILAAAISSTVHFNDEATVLQMNDFAVDMPSERKFKDSGAMVAPCSIARLGIMQYRASECGAMFADRNPNDIINIATLEADLFDADSIESYRSCPITVQHPVDFIDTDNAGELQKGNLDSIPVADSNMLVGNIVINDASTIKLIDEGLNQLSSGTTCTLVMADADAGYDAYKTNIRANHIALVSSGRNGNAKIADEDIKLSDAEVKLADTEAKLVDALAQVTQMTTDAEVSSAKLDDTLAKLVVADEAVLAAKAKITDVAIEALVASRLLFVQEVATLSDMDITGKTTIESKRAVMAELRDTVLTDKSDTYIEALFDIALADSDTESPMTNLLRKQVNVEINDKVVAPISKATTARENAIKRNQGNK
jgi:hypothetical protein